MKIKFAAILFATTLFMSCNHRPQEIELNIFHTNDTHSCIEPTLNDKGGYVRRATYLAQQRDTCDGELLLFDSGDFSQGSLYYNQYKGETEIELMNQMGYDAAAIGNHEFDFGLENMAQLFRLAQFPIVCANYDFTGTPVEGLVKPYTIITRKGLKIGIFGLGTNPKELIDSTNYAGMIYNNPVEKAGEVAKILKETEKCDVVICLSHLGVGGKGEVGDEDLIKQTHNIDVVLGGHSHTLFKEPQLIPNSDGGQVLMQQMGKNGQYVGRVTLQFTQTE